MSDERNDPDRDRARTSTLTRPMPRRRARRPLWSSSSTAAGALPRAIAPSAGLPVARRGRDRLVPRSDADWPGLGAVRPSIGRPRRCVVGGGDPGLEPPGDSRWPREPVVVRMLVRPPAPVPAPANAGTAGLTPKASRGPGRGPADVARTEAALAVTAALAAAEPASQPTAHAGRSRSPAARHRHRRRCEPPDVGTERCRSRRGDGPERPHRRRGCGVRSARLPAPGCGPRCRADEAPTKAPGLG